MKVFSVGYAAFTIDTFLETLKAYSVATVVDVRSHPYSKISPMFIKKNLAAFLSQHDINYLYLGHLLGGKSHPPYPERMETEAFKRGIDHIENGIKPPPAIMCVEPVEQNCHRRYILNYLREHGHEIIPILPPRESKSIPIKQSSLDKFLE